MYNDYLRHDSYPSCSFTVSVNVLSRPQDIFKIIIQNKLIRFFGNVPNLKYLATSVTIQNYICKELASTLNLGSSKV